MKISAIDVRPGTILDYNNKLWRVEKIDIMQPGKGASVIQVEMRDVRAGTKTNVRWRTQETVERVRLEQEGYTYLFQEGDLYTFMHKETFEQMPVSRDLIGDQAAFLQEGMEVEIETFEGEPLNVSLPDTAVCEVTETDPVVKGQTAAASYKPAILDNGVRIMVPPFVESGDKLVVKIAESAYVERFKG